MPVDPKPDAVPVEAPQPQDPASDPATPEVPENKDAEEDPFDEGNFPV